MCIVSPPSAQSRYLIRFADPITPHIPDSAHLSRRVTTIFAYK